MSLFKARRSSLADKLEIAEAIQKVEEKAADEETKKVVEKVKKIKNENE